MAIWPRCLSNIELFRKQAVLDAIKETGAPIAWCDIPDEEMASYRHRDQYGSIWITEEVDIEAFWRAYERRIGQ